MSLLVIQSERTEGTEGTEAMDSAYWFLWSH